MENRKRINRNSKTPKAASFGLAAFLFSELHDSIKKRNANGEVYGKGNP